jgi:hypothetical protein
MDALTNSSAYAKRRRRSLVLSVIGALILFFLLILPRIYGHFRSGASLTAESQLTSRVEQKKFSQVLRLSGTTQATRSFIVSAPQLEGAQLNNLNITALIPAGSAVNQDEILVQFDPQAQVKDFLDKQKTYTDLVSQVEQKKAEGEITKAKDDTALAQSENALKKAQLEVQRNEIVSRIDAEKNQEALEEAQVTLSQIKKTYDLKRTAATAAVRILEIQRDRAQEAMRYAQSNSDKMTIRAPMKGVAVLNTIWVFLSCKWSTLRRWKSERWSASPISIAYMRVRPQPCTSMLTPACASPPSSRKFRPSVSKANSPKKFAPSPRFFPFKAMTHAFSLTSPPRSILSCNLPIALWWFPATPSATNPLAISCG